MEGLKQLMKAVLAAGQQFRIGECGPLILVGSKPFHKIIDNIAYYMEK
jgi:hypothetical protein